MLPVLLPACSGLLLLLLCLSAAAVEASRGLLDDYVFQRWETEHGLPENSATAFAQTADGYLWFGTFNGLVRFDGVNFTVLGPGQIPAMKDSGVVNLFLDARQRLWVSTYDSMLLREGDSWRRLGEAEGWTGGMARSFAGRPNGDVFITDFKGRLFESAGDGVRELAPPEAMEQGQECIGGVDDEGRWWVVQNRFIGRREGDRWVEKFGLPGLGAGEVGCGPARGGGLWLKLGRELRRWQHGTVTEQRPITENTGGFWSMMEDSLGNVWVSSYHLGMARIAPDGSLARWDDAGGGSDHGRCVFEDREGNLWFGTSGDGLARACVPRFQTVKIGGARRGVQVTSVARRAAGGFWVATSGHGLSQIDANGAVSRVEIPDPTRMASYLVSVLEDRGGSVWLGTAGHGLRRWSGGKLDIFPAQVTGGDTPRTLFEDRKGRVWSGGGSGLACYESGNWRSVDPGGNKQPVAVLMMAEDAQGSIWVAHDRGLARSSDGENFEPVRAERGALPRITGLWPDAGGTMWLGAEGQGLLRWRADRVAAVADFPSVRADHLFGDARGNLWVTAGHRLLRSSLPALHASADGGGERLVVQDFGPADGLRAKQFSAAGQPAAAQDVSGRLCFASVAGAVLTDPAALQLNTLAPPVQVTRIHWHREGKGPDDAASQADLRIPSAAPVLLPPGSRYIEIHYAALSLTAPEKNRYEVRLDGVDAGWVKAGDKRAAFYHELAPGDYVFHVRGSNNDGVWNETGASVRFIVQPFYWQTTWFRLLVVTLAAGLITGTMWTVRLGRRKRRAERRAYERELQTAREELAHLTRVAMLGELSGSLAHELNQPLTAVLSNAQAGMRFLVNGKPDLQEMEALLQDIAEDAKRAGGIIHGMRAMFKKDTRQELQPVDVNDAVRQVLALLHSEYVGRRVAVEFMAEDNLPPVLAGKVELMQVLINLVLNSLDAIKGMPDPRRVSISTGAEDDFIAIRVRDSGTGIPPEVKEKLFTPFVSTKSGGLGLGLAISRGIVERFGGRLTAENHPRGGAVFCIFLPAGTPPKAPLQPHTSQAD